jgi:DNA-binding response OmpR family regulator
METILVINNDPAVRDLLIHNIAAAGYQVLEAASGPEAVWLARLYPEPIDLTIIDQTLDDQEGIDLAAEIAAIRPGIRLLLLSGLPEENLARLSQCNLGLGFLQKPFTPRALFDRIRQILADSNAAGCRS